SGRTCVSASGANRGAWCDACAGTPGSWRPRCRCGRCPSPCGWPASSAPSGAAAARGDRGDQVRPPSGAGRPRTGPGGVSLCSSSRGEGHLWRDTSSGVGPCWSGRQSQATASYWGACDGSGGGRDGHLRGGRWGVGRAVAEHRGQHIEAASSEGDEGLVVLLLLGPLAVVVGAGVRVFQRCERGEEQGSFEDLVALP